MRKEQRCTGSRSTARCAAASASVRELAPDVIEVGKDGLASVRTGSTSDPAVLEAADACPMAAITVFEEKAA